MIRFFFTVVLLLVSGLAHAQSYTNTQRLAMKTAILAEPSLTTAVANRDDNAIVAWCNAASTTDAWLIAVDTRTLFEASDITKYDALTAGKRASWDRMERNAPLDVTRAKIRTAVVDVWGATDSVVVLQALREKATNCQNAVGGTTRTTNTVSGLDRAWTGRVTVDNIPDILR